MEIIFVCTGNTCRSPLAQGLMKKLLIDRGIDGIKVSSAGLAAFTGDEASEKSVNAAKKYGVDISAHRARRVSEYMLENGLFVCMTASHAEALKPFVKEKNLFVIGNGIADPYGGTQDDYDRCARQIREALPRLLCSIVSLHTSIVPMNSGHIKKIAEIERKCFSLPWTENSLREELDNENAHFLSAVFNGQVIGYIGIIEICGQADVTNVAVLPEYRRCGIGEKLMKEAENGALSRSCDSITLEVRISNSTAISLYNKSGYRREGIRKNFYEKPAEDALLMTKFFEKGQNQ